MFKRDRFVIRWFDTSGQSSIEIYYGREVAERRFENLRQYRYCATLSMRED